MGVGKALAWARMRAVAGGFGVVFAATTTAVR
jgi:hypothetical protein